MTVNIMEKRLKGFREKLAEKDIDGALLEKKENTLYMSGFTGDSTWLIITRDSAVLVTDFRYTEQATAQAELFQVVQYQGNIIVALADILKEKGIKRLGIEEGYTTWERYQEYSKGFPVEELVPLKGTAEAMRLVKDEEELNIIREAARIADQAFSQILGSIRPGVAEIEIAAELEYFMKRNGATGASFETIVASGKRASLPHGAASEKKLESGDVITLDFGAVYNHYCSDMTRTVFLGKPDEEIKRIYNLVLEAQLNALEGARAGAIGRDIDRIARDRIYGGGFEGRFGHGLGHGVGLEIHEEPRLSPAGGVKMENNMVVTVEPGIYIPGLGGVRIEDLIIIRDDRPLNLTSSTKELVIV